MKTRIYAAVITATLFLSGCSAGTEVGERAFVQLMGIERENELYSVSMQIYKSESGKAEADLSKANSTTANGSGETIQAALADAETTLGKKLFLGHIKMLVIGKGVQNPADELSLFLDGSVSPACPVAYSDDPAAVAETLIEEGSFSAEQILALMESSASQGKTVYTSVAELAAGTGVLGTGAALPVISAEEKTVSFDGIVLARKNGTDGTLGENAVTGVKLLLDQFESGDKITISTEVDGRRAAVFITGAKTKLKTEISGGQLRVDADISLKLTIAENPYGIESGVIEKAVREQVSDMCILAYTEAVHNNGCDIFGIKKLVRRDCPEKYNDYCNNEKSRLAGSVLNIRITDKLLNEENA